MALPVLDGNQTATTLSSVVTGGEHIVAHSVVSLGSNAIANITSAVSGSVVSISNFPASQSTTFGAVTGSVSVLNFPSTQTIAGTVTANLANVVTNDIFYFVPAVRVMGTGNDGVILQGIDANSAQANVFEGGAIPVVGRNNDPVAISGTVTIGSLPNGVAFGQQLAEGFDNFGGVPVNITGSPITLPISGTVTIGNSVTIGSLPAISGTVTAAAPNGSLTTRFGTPTTASVAFATSCVTNANRKYLLIQNVTTGSNVITVGIGFTPTTTQGIQLTAGAGITFESSYIPTGAVYVLSSVTASNFTILEA